MKISSEKLSFGIKPQYVAKKRESQLIPCTTLRGETKKDTVSFSSTSSENERAPLGTRISRAIGKLLHNVSNVPAKVQTFAAKLTRPSSTPASGPLDGRNKERREYVF